MTTPVQPSVPAAPKVFLSYAWTSAEYSAEVVRLASRLRENGVDVVLDAAHLVGGQDLGHFMERTVTDPSVTHVLLLCNPTYAAKADGREGGVGAETSTVSPVVFASARESKFIPVIMERDEHHRALRPAYVASRVRKLPRQADSRKRDGAGIV